MAVYKLNHSPPHIEHPARFDGRQFFRLAWLLRNVSGKLVVTGLIHVMTGCM
jgi:hypothetical protein